MHLKNRINRNDNNHGYLHGNTSNNNSTPGRARAIKSYHRFNRGRCNFGSGCRYEHHCSYCLKFGHGAVNCRKTALDRQDRMEKNNVKNNNCLLKLISGIKTYRQRRGTMILEQTSGSELCLEAGSDCCACSNSHIIKIILTNNQYLVMYMKLQ